MPDGGRGVVFSWFKSALDVLEAALRPADASYLYFVSRNDGTHEFANTLREHNRNVRKWQVEFFRARRRSQE